MRDWGPGAVPAEVPARLEQCVAGAAGDAQAVELARTYVFAARVGGQAADHERAARWLEGWMGAPRRTSEEAHAALVDGIRFAQRLHRALGIDAPAAG